MSLLTGLLTSFPYWFWSLLINFDMSQTPHNVVNYYKIQRGATVTQFISEQSEQWHWILPLHKLKRSSHADEASK